MMEKIDRTSSGDGDFLRWVVVIVLILTCSMAAGFTWRLYAGSRAAAPSVPARDTARHAAAPRADTAVRVIRSAASAPAPDFDGMMTALRRAKAQAAENDVQLPSVSEEDFATVPSATTDTMSTLYVVPPDALAEMLYGQQLVAKTLWGNYGWTVERGEVIEMTIDRVWQDPERISHGVYVTFVVMAEGKGMRASGLLRYHGDEGGEYAIRDFTPTRVERVGSW